MESAPILQESLMSEEVILQAEFRESLLPLEDEWIFFRHSELRPDRPSLVFIHGLGESGLCFREAFAHPRLRRYNLVAPDNVGYGRSSPAHNGDYSFDAQLNRLQELVDRLQLSDVTLIGHSLGGILATLWCLADPPLSPRRLVNIEGSVTQDHTIISKLAHAAFLDCGNDFSRWRQWFEIELMAKLVFDQLGPGWESCRRYYASLWFSRPEAFLANALETYQRTRATSGNGINEIGAAYRSVTIPKIYYWGQGSLPEASHRLLTSAGLSHRGFPGANHWVMIDVAEEFYAALADFLEEK
jgi:pimeloyl-ACP methyl ester carboxylesterase